MVTIHKLPSSELISYNFCFDQINCHRFNIIDSASNGICCENGNGWYDVFWNGRKLAHDPFDNGSEQTLLFGKCETLSSPISPNKAPKCAAENELSKHCNLSGGPDKCCSGLVCHDYPPWNCVKEENAKCSGPNQFSRQCGSSHKDAPPSCCSELSCKEKK